MPMPTEHPNLSPCDRMIRRRERIFIRDWILVLVALGLALAAGAFRPDHRGHEAGRASISTPSVP